MQKRQAIVSWILVVSWMIVIFYLSAQPGTQSSSLSSGVLEPLINVLQFLYPPLVEETNKDIFHFIIRKSAHFFAYFLLGILALRAFRSSGYAWRNGALYALILSVIYAITDEIHQLFVPGRSGEVRDVMIDSAGAFVGIGLYIILAKVFVKRKRYNEV